MSSTMVSRIVEIFKDNSTRTRHNSRKASEETSEIRQDAAYPYDPSIEWYVRSGNDKRT